MSGYKHILKRHSILFENLTYISVLQVFVLISPLITYPYLVRILGKELYGWVITAQIIASYCSIFVDFGFKRVSARHIAIFRENKEKLSEIMSTILTLQILLWCCCLLIYIAIIYFIPSYRQHWMLFVFSFGLTFNELLFPQYFFQGIEKMKYITMLNILTRLISVALIFFCIRTANDYIYVPLLFSIGYLIGGVLSLYFIFVCEGLKFCCPTYSNMKFYLKDASPIFFTDVICTIKDKLNYILLGTIVGIGNVVVYDLGSKFVNVLLKPAVIVETVIFPKIAKERSLHLFNRVIYLLIGVISIGIVLLNIFLPWVVHFFIAEDICLLPIRLYLLAPIIVGISSFISSNLFVALGYTKYVLYSIIVTTIIYLTLLFGMYFTGNLTTVTSFVLLTVLSYFGELVYRLVIMHKIKKIEISAK